MTSVDLWVDPACPFAWITSRWLLEVQTLRDISINWHIMSLSYLNKAKAGSSVETDAWLALAWQPVRLIEAAAVAHGADAVKALYNAIGTKIHLGKEKISTELLALALSECDLPESLLASATDEYWNDAVIKSHEQAISIVGSDVGTPVIAIEGVGFFGPVISPAPKGEQAAKLWDGVEAMIQTPGFFELKRSRTEGPIFN